MAFFGVGCWSGWVLVNSLSGKQVPARWATSAKLVAHGYLGNDLLEILTSVVRHVYKTD